MMHYGFCRKHADQTGEGGCPECAMNHQQATISAMTETAKEASRAHVELHNQNVALQAEVARLTLERDQWKGVFDRSQDDEAALRTRIAELEAGLREYGRHHWQCNAFNPTERDRIEGRDKCDCDAQIANRLLGEVEK